MRRPGNSSTDTPTSARLLMAPHPAPRHSRRHWPLVALAAFNALSAVGGGIGMLATGGLGMPQALLATSPFDSFAGPAIILLAVVGGTQLIALLSVSLDARIGGYASVVAGLGMVIWIITESIMIGDFSWPQAIYLATGLAQIVVGAGTRSRRAGPDRYSSTATITSEALTTA